MRPLVMPLLAVCPLIFITGCIYHDNDGPGAFGLNAIPYVEDAEAGCTWSGGNNDWVWYFEAGIADGDGPYDVTEVWADVYDMGGAYIESFSLYRETPAPEYWFSDWLQTYSRLDCMHGSYTVDIVAYDTFGEFDVVTVLPTYNP